MKSSNLNHFLNSNRRAIALGIIFSSCIAKLFYIFYFTSYFQSIEIDMAAYWYGAFNRLWQDKYSIVQYAIFPPFYIYFLSEFIRLIDFFNLMPWALNIVILFNVMLFSYSAYFVFLLLNRFIVRKVLVFLGLFIYAFSYTATYYNALILADNLGIPLLVISTSLIILYKNSMRINFLAGLLLGICISAKPSLLLLSVPFFLYILIVHAKKLLLIFFVLGLMIAPVGTLIENYHISGGKLKSFAAYGGTNFFQGWAFIEKVESHLPNSWWWVTSPGLIKAEVNMPAFITHEPFYHQGYFYKLGLETLLNHPERVLIKLHLFKNLFFGVIGPSHFGKAPWGHDWLMPSAQYMLYIMFLCLGIMPLFFLRYANKNVILFFYSFMLIFLFSFYMMGVPDRRYLYHIEFLLIIIFFMTLDKIFSLFKMFKKEILFYFLCMAGIHFYIFFK